MGQKVRKKFAVGEGDWPPDDGKAFIRDEEFGGIVLGHCEHLAQRYATMDFTDAASQIFDWFDRKLSTNRRFINARRFPTRAAFGAYVRQCVWNAARLAERKRQRNKEIAPLPAEQAFVAEDVPADDLIDLVDRIEKLPFPVKEIVERIVFDGEDIPSVADRFGMSVRKVQRYFEDGLDKLGNIA